MGLPDTLSNQMVRFVLREPDYSTASLVSIAINRAFANTATAIDEATIQVQLPGGTNEQTMQRLAAIESLTIDLTASSKVVINERTGTIVIGGNVELLPVVIAHGGLEIVIQKDVVYPQMPSAQGGQNANSGVINNGSMPYGRDYILQFRKSQIAKLQAQEQMNDSKALEAYSYKPPSSSVQQLATALNNLKVTPRDLISIFQALKQAGSLQGELIIQ